MKCSNCKRELSDTDIYCRFCGQKLLREGKKKEVSVPDPKQLPSGTWSAQLMVNGERVRVTCATRKEYYTKARAIKLGLISAPKKKKEMTLREAVTLYIDSRRNRLSVRSIENYEYVRDKRFQSIMDLPLSQITSTVFDTAVDQELARPSRKGGTVKPKTVKTASMLIATVLRKYGTNDIQYTSPEIQRKFPEIPTPEEVYNAVKGTDIELPTLLAMWMTLTISEIRGLTKSKSIRGSKLYVVETVVDVAKIGAVRRDRAKEENRPRCLDIPDYIAALIRQVPGDVIEARTSHAVNERFKRVMREHGITKISFHKLRHISASVMAEEQIPSNVAQERGGWKTDYTMKTVYTHTFENTRKTADKKINLRFDKMIRGGN